MRASYQRAKKNTLTLDCFTDPDKDPLLSDKGKNDPVNVLSKQETSNELAAAIDQLPEKWAYILRSRFGMNGPEQTLREVALALNLNFKTVADIEKRALKKLKALLGG